MLYQKDLIMREPAIMRSLTLRPLDVMQPQRYKSLVSSARKISGRYTRQQPESTEPNGNVNYTIPAHGSYGNLLFDPRWKAKRAEILHRDNGACVICRNQSDLQVHHRQYQFVKAANAFRMPWAYPDHLLITLCKSCHQRGHNKFKVPTLII